MPGSGSVVSGETGVWQLKGGSHAHVGILDRLRSIVRGVWALFRHLGIFRGRPSWVPPTFLAVVMSVFVVRALLNEQVWRAGLFLGLAVLVLMSWRIRERRASS